MKTQHTPTPWEFQWSPNEGYNVTSRDTGISVFDSQEFTDKPTKENAEYIVRAVNSHDALLKIVEQISKKHCRCRQVNFMRPQNAAIKTCQSCRAKEAIKQAEGK